MKLKLDENIGVRGREHLVAAGHDVATVYEQGLATSADKALAAACAAEGRALVTLDLDFANPLNFPPEEQEGIAVLRLEKGARPQDLQVLIETLARALESKDLSGQLWIIERGRVREYDRNRSGLS